MSFFIFNEFDSRDSLIITQPVVRPSWAQEINEITTGSVSKVIQISKTFGSSPVDIPTVIKETSPASLRDIYNKLRGFGKLVLSSDLNVYMRASANVLQPQGVAQTMAELDVSFNLLPFAYSLNPMIQPFTATYTEIENTGTVFSAPEICITSAYAGMVDIIVNGAGFKVSVPDTLTDKEIVIDCDAEVTYYTDDGGNKISINHLTYNDYPLLHTGVNYVKYAGPLTAAKINVRERWY